MDRARIEEEFYGWFDIETTDHNPCDIKNFAEHIAKIAMNDALEQAAKICDEQGGLSADVAAMRIRNLKTGSM